MIEKQMAERRAVVRAKAGLPPQQSALHDAEFRPSIRAGDREERRADGVSFPRKRRMKCRKLNSATAERMKPRAEWRGGELAFGNITVRLMKNAKWEHMAVKIGRAFGMDESVRLEIAILKRTNHPLVICS
jgi:hypothetical protein